MVNFSRFVLYVPLCFISAQKVFIKEATSNADELTSLLMDATFYAAT